eukprot:6165075-Karenia_brevis.AAC.1
MDEIMKNENEAALRGDEPPDWDPHELALRSPWMEIHAAGRIGGMPQSTEGWRGAELGMPPNWTTEWP